MMSSRPAGTTGIPCLKMTKKKESIFIESGAWEGLPIISAMGKLRQENEEFEDSLGSYHEIISKDMKACRIVS